MPIYEYECEECKEVVEAWQSISDEPLATCEKCGGSLHKLISMSSFHLKGGGWYADGYGSSGNSKTTETTETKTSKTPSKTPSKTTPSCPKESKGTTCCAKGKPCKCAA